MRLLLLLSFLLVPLGAQNPVRVSTDVKVVDGAVGATGVLRVHVDVEPGWHVYAPALPSEGSLPGLVPFTATSRRPDLPVFRKGRRLVSSVSVQDRVRGGMRRTTGGPPF